MFEKFSRSWTLVKASGAVLMQDQKLVVFPIMSSIASLIVGACFVLPMLGLHAFDGLSGGGRGISAVTYGFAFLLFLSQNFVMFFLNAVLMGAAMIRMDGGIPTVSDGLNIALLKAGPMQARCRPDPGLCFYCRHGWHYFAGDSRTAGLCRQPHRRRKTTPQRCIVMSLRARAALDSTQAFCNKHFYPKNRSSYRSVAGFHTKMLNY